MKTCNVVILMGLSGSGKSTIARFIQEHLRWPIISRDVIRHAMFDPCLYTEAEKVAAYEALKLALSVLVATDRSCVIDGMSFSRYGEYEEICELVRLKGGRGIPIYCDVPVEVAISRVRADLVAARHTVPIRDETFVREMHARFRKIPADVFRLDTDRRLDSVLESALAFVQNSRVQNS